MFVPLFHRLLPQQGQQDQPRMIPFLSCDQKLHDRAYLGLSSGIHELFHGPKINTQVLSGNGSIVEPELLRPVRPMTL